MSWKHALRARLRLLFRRAAAEDRMDEEIRFHLEMEVEKNIRAGMSPEEARRRAALAFGGVEKTREAVRDGRGSRALDAVARDVGYALRSFRSGRSGLLIPVAVLAVAIGAGTTTFSVVSGVLLDSFPVRDPERLVELRVAPLTQDPEMLGGGTLSRTSVELMLSETGAFESAAYYYGNAQPVLVGMGEPERVKAWRVAPEYFDVLGSRALLGRTLGAADAGEREGAPVVISHGFWVSRFGGARDAVGRTLRLDGRVHEVVGVMPPGFDFPAGAQLWQPAEPLAADTRGLDQTQGKFWLVARLAPGVTAAGARERIGARFAAYGAEHASFAQWGPNVAPVREMITGPIRKPLLLLMGAVALVLFIACANVAAVLLARGITRRRELAIRLSMGATRVRVARQLLIEAILLALLSGVAGTLIALAGVPLLVRLMGAQIPGTAQVEIDGRVLAATLAASTLTGLAAGLLPALLVAKQELSSTLRDGSAGSGTSSWRTRVGEGLVVFQVGLGTVLLTAAMLLAVSFVNLMRVDFGFDPGRVAVAQLRLEAERYSSPEQRRQFMEEVSDRAASIPGATSAALSSGVPLDGGSLGSVEVPGEAVPEETWAWFTEVTPTFFQTLGIRLLRGRAFQPGERPGGKAILVNEAFVSAYLGGKDPLGRRVLYYGGGVEGEIVGVVGDTRQRSVPEPAAPQLYSLLEDGSWLKLSVRADGDAGDLVANLKQAIRSVDPLLPIDRIGVLADLVDESVASQRLYAVVVSSFAAIALLITALGIYGLSAYSVSRRSREIAVRLSLGATAGHIRATTLGRATLLAGVGVALGMVGAWMGARLLDAFVFGLSTQEPRIFLSVALLLTLAAVAAAYLPARRASRIDPMLVLRAD